MSKHRQELFSGSVIPITTGRFNPLHTKHEQEVLASLLFNSSLLHQQQDSDTNSFPPFLIVMGSSGDNRDLSKNPFSFEQRVEMIMLATKKLLQTDFISMLSEESRCILAQDGGIDRLIDRETTFLYYTDSSEKNTPPSLTRLADAIKLHCEQHNIPLEKLASYVCVKKDEAGRYEVGRQYQIYGDDSYKDIHQMTAVAKALGFQFYEDRVVENGVAVSATQIRQNLQDNFNLLSPEVFFYVQNQLALAYLNKRAVGASQDGDDKSLSPQQLCDSLAMDNKMLGLDGINPAVIDINPELRTVFDTYRRVVILPTSTKETTAKPLQNNSRECCNIQ